jgi:hypothetical protein
LDLRLWAGGIDPPAHESQDEKRTFEIIWKPRRKSEANIFAEYKFDKKEMAELHIGD